MSIVEHRKDYFYLELREEYLIISKECKYKKPVKDGAKCKASPHCKALILAILERWTDSKQKKGEDLAIYMTYPMWMDEMQELFGRNVIIDSLDELIGEGLMSREKHKMYGKDTYKYLLNYQELNRRIKLLPTKDAFTSKRHETDEAFTNQPDAFTNKPQTEECHLQVNAMPFTSKPNIESNIDSNNIDSERKNERSQETSNVPAQDASSRSIAHSSFVSSEVVFPPEAETVYQLAVQCHITYLKRDEKHRDNCILLAEKGVTTLEKMESLISHCRQVPFLKDKTLNLKNLVNELPGWLQLQRKSTASSTSSVVSTPGKNTMKWLQDQEEHRKRILEQDAKREGPRPSLKEIREKLAKERKNEREKKEQ